jgi:hypothetical protein
MTAPGGPGERRTARVPGAGRERTWRRPETIGVGVRAQSSTSRQVDINPAMRPPRPVEGEPAVFPAAPVLRGSKPPRRARIGVVAVVAGALGLFVGLQVGAGRSPAEPAPPASPAPPTAAPSRLPTVTASPAPARSDTSEFARAFRPLDMIARLEGGAECVGRAASVPGFTGPGPSRTLVESWLIFCPVKASAQAAFLTDLTISLEREVPFGTMSWSGPKLQTTVAYYPYTEGQFAGAVTLAAAPAGVGFEIAITLEERRPG